jgi:uncharacterized protein (DUF433 family)/DNA-binding transcriptional MerR regulator
MSTSAERGGAAGVAVSPFDPTYVFAPDENDSKAKYPGPVMPATPTPIGSYTAAEVARLAGVTPHRVGRWAREGIVLPSVSRRPHRYSYADAGEAILAHYLVRAGKAPSEIKEIVHLLRERFGDWPLATAPLSHDGRLVVVWGAKRRAYVSVDMPENDVIGGTLLNLKAIRESLGRGGWVTIDHPRAHVEVDPNRHSGTPVVRGRRIPTSLVASLAATDGGRDTLHEDYDLSDDEIDDAIGYEKDLAQVAA